jgi:ribosomal 50S subunit-recycling heat shock protein
MNGGLKRSKGRKTGFRYRRAENAGTKGIGHTENPEQGFYIFVRKSKKWGDSMRLDKFLKVSRLIKRRTLAKEVCDQGRVSINGKAAKAGTNVAVGDEITIRFGHKTVTARVEAIRESAKKEDAGQMFTILGEEPAGEEEQASSNL